MAQQQLSTLSGSLFQPRLGSDVTSQVHRATPFLDFLQASGLLVPGRSNPSLFNINTAGNSTTAVISEGDAMSTVGSQTYVRPSVPAFTVNAVCGYSALVEDNIAAGAYVADVEQLETFVLAGEDVRKKIEDELLGTTDNRGILSLVDDTTTYAGLAPASNTTWKAISVSGSVALTTTFMDTCVETILGTTYGSGEMPNLILMSPGMASNYKQIAAPSVSNSAFRIVNPGQNGTKFDLGGGNPMVFGELAYNGIPILVCPAMSATDVVFLNTKYFQVELMRNLTVKVIGTTNDDKKFAVSMSVIPILKKRKACGKVYGVPA